MNFQARRGGRSFAFDFCGRSVVLFDINSPLMSRPAPVTHSVDSEGVAWITFDDSVARANVFNPATLAALRGCLDALSSSRVTGGVPVKVVVIRSAKERIFIAGADLKWLVALPDAGAATHAAREGQALFELIANFKVPVVCAIHGACAGGGYELALACAWRLASDAPETRIGLPEVGLGLIPAWGGCTRLPRLIGVPAAVDFILRAGLVPAAAALAAGLIDEVVPTKEITMRAKAAALRLADEGKPARPTPAAPVPDFFSAQRATISLRRPGQPAALAVLEVVEKSRDLSGVAALELEAIAFGKVAVGGVAKNLMHVFQLKAAARKSTLDRWFPEPAEAVPAVPFRTIGIIGAGVMGSGLAHWCAAHGYGVILCDSSRAAIERGVLIIRGLFAEGVSRGKVTADAAHRMTGGIGITTSLEDFELCDLVIETITEDVEAKRKLFAELSEKLPPDCVLASNTSVLPIEELAAGVVNPGRVIGLHFFNPVSRMRLVEVGLGSATARVTAERALGLVRSLGLTAVISRSAPGHFVMRVLAFYLNEGCRLWEQGVTTEQLDYAQRDWGWPMGPLRLIDEIGVDVIDQIFGGMAHYFPDRFERSTLCRQMVAKGLSGRKNGASAGFYRYEDGREVLNPAMAEFAPGSVAAAAAWDPKAIQEHLIGVMIGEANRAVAEGVVQTDDEADLALILGAGFPASRGGLLRHVKNRGKGAAEPAGQLS